MASKAIIVERLLLECGKQSSTVRAKIERKVGEVALELLLESGGQVQELSKLQEIVFNTTKKRYKLNGDFFSPSPTFSIFDSDDNFVSSIEVISKVEFYRKLEQRAPLSVTIAYIEFEKEASDGRGYYLHLPEVPTEEFTAKLDYYREPTENDVGAIKKWTWISRGVRAAFPELFGPDSQIDAKMYYDKLGQVPDNPVRTTTNTTISLSKRVRQRNKNAHLRGAGG